MLKVSALSFLRKSSVVVVDTGDIESIAKYCPVDATTNPSLILMAAQKPTYAHLLEDAVRYARDATTNDEERLEVAMNKLLVNFGTEILKLIPGRVSTEVNAKYSFDTEATIKCALRIIDLYKQVGVTSDRILIKIASTWEGIQAAKVLERDYGINCNLTLLFSMAQAVECANAHVTLVSPFVGRTLDWYKQHLPEVLKENSPDPGVMLVRRIYTYYKHHNFKTIVMGASFRTPEQALNLVGCDKLTLSPKILDQLDSTLVDDLPLNIMDGIDQDDPQITQQIHYTEPQFRWLLHEDQMATEKLDEGIRLFARDAGKLKAILSEMIQ